LILLNSKLSCFGILNR
jgi:hypothetical protein